tara:strand:+ start:117 stop:308 length:192 start_codon:yes stop_codon:yes gene_type:complete
MVFIAHLTNLKKQKSRLLTKRLKVINNFSGGILLNCIIDIDSKINVLNEQINWHNRKFIVMLN